MVLYQGKKECPSCHKIQPESSFTETLFVTKKIHDICNSCRKNKAQKKNNNK